jgi:general secretion pathway protein B
VSFILDALRKSEHERQRQAGPAIAEMPIARPASRLPVALGVIGALLAVNLAVLLYFMLRQDAPEVQREEAVPATTTAPAAAAPAPLPAAAAVPPAQTGAALVPAPTARELQPLADVAAPTAAPPPQYEPPSAPDPSLLPAPPAPRDAPAVADRVQPGAANGGEGNVPRLDMLPAQATAGLPALNLDLHIYASSPAQRAVFINGRRYREGESLPEGVEVLEITPEGAVLGHRGQRFLLPRP